MKALIFAAGKGTRMLPLTADTPKPLLTVLEKPLLGYILESLPDEISELIIVVGYKAEMIRAYLGDEYKGRKVTYIEQQVQDGTGGALMLCKPFLADGERFLLMFADDVYDKASVAACLAHPLAILVAEVDDPRRYGVLEVDGEGRIVGIEEKPEHPKSNLVAPGAYVLDTRIFGYPLMQQPNGEYYLTTALQSLISEHSVTAVRCNAWLSFAYPEDLQKAEQQLQEGTITL